MAGSALLRIVKAARATSCNFQRVRQIKKFVPFGLEISQVRSTQMYLALEKG
jgi:hypothetical protein